MINVLQNDEDITQEEDKDLVIECLQKGKKAVRMEKYPGIYSTELRLENGMIWVYKNETKDMGL